MAEKLIRDPVHDVIAFRTDREPDALLFRLINAAEFQRLRRIRQLGFASLAYPGADHSRYSHSLGVVETARQMIGQLRQSIHIDPRAEVVCLSACLLHDLGHGPFSHVFERISGFDHEGVTCRIVEDPASEVHQILCGHDPQLPHEIAGFLRGNSAHPFLCDILSSQLDADRLDYLLRDNLMTGSRYGDFDLGWLLRVLAVDRASGHLAVTWKGISAVEAYLQSRYHMYRNVYFHKVVRSAEGMVKLALQRAKRLAVQERLAWPPRDHVVYQSLLGLKLTTAEFTELDDVSMLQCFKIWANADDAPLAAICKGLLYRRLFKTIDLTHIESAERARSVVSFAERAIQAAGGDAAYDLFYDEPADTPYETYSSDSCSASGGDILVIDPAGSANPVGALSPFTQALNRQLMFRRLHVAPQWKDRVASEIAKM